MEVLDDKSKCFNLTWKIENFGMCLFEEKMCLEAPIFKTETVTENTWWELNVKHDEQTYSAFKFVLSRITGKPKECMANQKCQLSVVYRFGEIKSHSLTSYTLNSYYFTVKKSEIISENELPSKLKAGKDILIVCCTIWYPMIKPEDRLIHTMLKEVNFDFDFDTSQVPVPQKASKSLIKSSCPKYIHENDNIQLITTIQYSYRRSDSSDFTVFVEMLTKSNSSFFFVHCTLHTYGLDIRNQIKTQNLGAWTYSIPHFQGALFNLSTKFVFKSIVAVEMTPLQELPLALPTEFSSPSAISSSAKHSNNNNSAKNAEISGRKLSDDFLHFYQESKLSDTTLSTEGKTFPVHRSILAARSSVFHAMFEKDEMSEARSGVVDIDDVDSETMDRMLVFLYGDSLQGLQWREAAQLYYEADKYAVQPLKQKCADILKARMTLDNVCDALVLADTHSDELLMKWAVDFINDHQEVVSSPNWQQLEESKPRLVVKITKELFLKRVKKMRMS